MASKLVDTHNPVVKYRQLLTVSLVKKWCNLFAFYICVVSVVYSFCLLLSPGPVSCVCVTTCLCDGGFCPSCPSCLHGTWHYECLLRVFFLSADLCVLYSQYLLYLYTPSAFFSSDGRLIFLSTVCPPAAIHLLPISISSSLCVCVFLLLLKFARFFLCVCVRVCVCFVFLIQKNKPKNYKVICNSDYFASIQTWIRKKVDDGSERTAALFLAITKHEIKLWRAPPAPQAPQWVWLE